MRILKLSIPEEETQNKNLKPINLTTKPFGSVVALVGKNGAGKSRILDLVEQYPAKIQIEQFLESHLEFIPQEFFRDLGDNLNQVKRYYSESKIIDANSAQKEIALRNIQGVSSPITARISSFSSNYVKRINTEDLMNIKEALPNHLTSFQNILESPPINLNPQQARTINEFDFLITSKTFEYINGLASMNLKSELNSFLNSSRSQIIKEKKKHKDDFDLLKKYLKIFLSKEFNFEAYETSDDKVIPKLMLSEREFSFMYLSPGQKILFAYAILFFIIELNSKVKLNECVLILDEPEKHLHPEAQVNLIKALKELVKDKGQLWMATHSVHILAELEYNEIFLVKDDQLIEPNRTIPTKSYDDLVGLSGHADKLKLFNNSISEWAYAGFMQRCFVEPEVVFGNSLNDSQFKLFKEFAGKSTAIDMLDFGAGVGRIGMTLIKDGGLRSKINYYAFEESSQVERLNQLQSLDFVKSVYSEFDQMADSSFDLILMCNVLHEIEPEKWLQILKGLRSKLRDNGNLLIIEDKHLPKGEKAHDFGYLILTEKQIGILMEIPSFIEYKFEEKNPRMVFAVIEKHEINPTPITVRSSIESLRDESFENIKELRAVKGDLDQGRKYANQTQLYINSILALEKLKA